MEHEIKLINIDPDDLSDVIAKLEQSFDIKLSEADVEKIITFEDLSDIIVHKVSLQHSDHCTSQQVFYKLRSVFRKLNISSKSNIHPDTALALLLPKGRRRKTIRHIEQETGFRLNILRAPHWLSGLWLLLSLLSLCFFLVHWTFGLSGILLCITGAWLSRKMGTVLDLVTLRELVNKITREQYIKGRRNNNTVNRNELRNLIRQTFSHDLSLPESMIKGPL